MDYRTISTDRQFKDATGYNRSSFENLLFDFTSTYFDLNGQSYEDYLEENVQQEPKLKTLGDALFFVLFQIKNDLIFGSLGVVFDMSASSALNNCNYLGRVSCSSVAAKERLAPPSVEQLFIGRQAVLFCRAAKAFDPCIVPRTL